MVPKDYNFFFFFIWFRLNLIPTEFEFFRKTLPQSGYGITPVAEDSDKLIDWILFNT